MKWCRFSYWIQWISAYWGLGHTLQDGFNFRHSFKNKDGVIVPVFIEVTELTALTGVPDFKHELLTFWRHNAPINVKPQRGGGVRHRWGIWFFEQIFNQMPHRRAINIGQIPHHFAINCNKYYINKSHSVQISPNWGQNANQNGDAIDDQIPHICPTPPLWGLTLIGA